MSKSKNTQESEEIKFLDDAEILSPETVVSVEPQTVSSRTPTSRFTKASDAEQAKALKYLDEITRKSPEASRTTMAHTGIERPLSRAGTPTPTLRKTERVRLGGGAPSVPLSATTPAKPGSSLKAPTQRSAQVSVSVSVTEPEEQQPAVGTTPASAPATGTGGWGWGNVWSTASAALQQAKSVVDEQVKNLPNNEQAKKWSEAARGYVNTEQLERLAQQARNVGISTLTEVLNAVAPPISEHEVIQVSLSHDMEGYEGVESLVYKSLTRIMEQVEGGDLVVNKRGEDKPKEKFFGDLTRDLNVVINLEAALKLSEASIEGLIRAQAGKNDPKPTPSNPTTYSNVYLRIQPFYTTIPTLNSDLSSSEPESTEPTHLQFLLHLSDPGHDLVHRTLTQTVSAKWLDQWERYEWIEDLMVEVLRVGMEVLGQDYLAARMRWMDAGLTHEEVPVVAAEDVDIPSSEV